MSRKKKSLSAQGSLDNLLAALLVAEDALTREWASCFVLHGDGPIEGRRSLVQAVERRLETEQDAGMRSWLAKVIEGGWKNVDASANEAERANAIAEARLAARQASEQAARDATYASELDEQRQAEAKHKSKAAAELTIALESILKKVPDGGDAPGN